MEEALQFGEGFLKGGVRFAFEQTKIGQLLGIFELFMSDIDKLITDTQQAIKTLATAVKMGDLDTIIAKVWPNTHKLFKKWDNIGWYEKGEAAAGFLGEMPVTAACRRWAESAPRQRRFGHCRICCATGYNR